MLTIFIRPNSIPTNRLPFQIAKVRNEMIAKASSEYYAKYLFIGLMSGRTFGNYEPDYEHAYDKSVIGLELREKTPYKL